jgi:RNA polymerase sigma-70 factor (ECF subfamily)
MVDRADLEAEDAALVAAMAAGDRTALARLYDRHGGLLLAVGLKILRDRREAEDLLHDVFLEAWRHAADFDPKRGKVRTWLAIRMRSRALDVRKSARVSRAAGDTELDRVPAVGTEEATGGDHDRVRGALGSLATDQRRVLELAYFDGLTCSEISARIEIPIGTVKSRMAAALRKMRELVGGEA